MRNPFARLARPDAAKPTLRERLTRASQALSQERGGFRRGDLALQPDPIFVAITECQRLYAAWCAKNALPLPAGTIDPTPEQRAASEAFHAYVESVLLETVPTTAAGCAALARFCVEFAEAEGFVLDEDHSNCEHRRVLSLIGRSPLL